MATLAPPQAVAKPREAVPWIWRLQSFLTGYLPVLMMAVLAAGTWWLVKNTPGAESPTAPVPLRHVPDYQMQGFSLERIGADGKLRMRVEGAEMRHYPDTDTVEIDSVRVRAVANDGRLLLASARRGLTNSDGSDLQMFGDVLVQTFNVDAQGLPLAQPKLVVRGEFLEALSNTEVLRSHLPVVIDYGAGGELHAPSFEYDHLHGLMRLTGRSTGRFDMPGMKNSSPAGKK